MSLFGLPANPPQASVPNGAGDITKDAPLVSPPDDGVSDMCFSPSSDLLAVTSWDKNLRVYEVSETNGESQGKALFEYGAPILNCTWTPDGKQVVGAGLDKGARLHDLAANSSVQVAAHDAPIRCCEFVDIPGNSGQPILATGSWDKSVKFWDLRQPSPVATLECADRVYTMSTRGQLLVIGTAERSIHVVNLNEPTKFYNTLESPLKFQTRAISCLHHTDGYAVGSIEGRCAIAPLKETPGSVAYSFRCHRDNPQPSDSKPISIHAINSISFHPKHGQNGVMASAGNDGVINFWNIADRERLMFYPNPGNTISSTAFNQSGNILAYAVSYDWSRGFDVAAAQQPNRIMLHAVMPGDHTSRKGAGSLRR